MTDPEFLNQLWTIIQQNSGHLTVMNREMGVVQTQVELLMKLFWIVITASIGAMVASIWSLIISRKNNNK